MCGGGGGGGVKCQDMCVVSQKNIPIVKGSSSDFIPMFRCKVRIKCLVHIYLCKTERKNVYV